MTANIMALLASAKSTTTEIEVPFLDDVVTIRLLSRKERKRIYPDQPAIPVPGSLHDRAQTAQTQLLELQATARELDAKNESLTAIDSPTDSEAVELEQVKKHIEAIKDDIPSLVTMADGLNREAFDAKLTMQAKLLQATLTDDTGEEVTIEQATKLVREDMNEDRREILVRCILKAHGVLEGEAPGER